MTWESNHVPTYLGLQLCSPALLMFRKAAKGNHIASQPEKEKSGSVIGGYGLALAINCAAAINQAWY